MRVERVEENVPQYSVLIHSWTNLQWIQEGNIVERHWEEKRFDVEKRGKKKRVEKKRGDKFHHFFLLFISNV